MAKATTTAARATTTVARGARATSVTGSSRAGHTTVTMATTAARATSTKVRATRAARATTMVATSTAKLPPTRTTTDA
eukprot:570354-Pyramimonas_sp.AAC.1